MKKIIISEIIEKKIIELIKEDTYLSLGGYSDKVLLMKKYLDNNYIKADIDNVDTNGDLSSTKIVILLDKRKEPTQYRFNLKQLFYRLQYRFQKILSNKTERDNFIWRLINDWYDNKITNNGSLSKY